MDVCTYNNLFLVWWITRICLILVNIEIKSGQVLLLTLSAEKRSVWNVRSRHDTRRWSLHACVYTCACLFTVNEEWKFATSARQSLVCEIMIRTTIHDACARSIRQWWRNMRLEEGHRCFRKIRASSLKNVWKIERISFWINFERLFAFAIVFRWIRCCWLILLFRGEIGISLKN